MLFVVFCVFVRCFLVDFKDFSQKHEEVELCFAGQKVGKVHELCFACESVCVLMKWNRPIRVDVFSDLVTKNIQILPKLATPSKVPVIFFLFSFILQKPRIIIRGKLKNNAFKKGETRKPPIPKHLTFSQLLLLSGRSLDVGSFAERSTIFPSKMESRAYEEAVSLCDFFFWGKQKIGTPLK